MLGGDRPFPLWEVVAEKEGGTGRAGDNLKFENRNVYRTFFDIPNLLEVDDVFIDIIDSPALVPLLSRVAGNPMGRMCPSCSGRMKILTALVKPGSVRAYLDGVGLPSRAPPIAPSRLDRQLEFDEAACSLRRVSADTPVPTRHAIAATRRFSMSSA